MHEIVSYGIPDMANGKRGPVGKAAEGLKAALVARLHNPGSFSPVDEGLRAAIQRVDAFLASGRSESEADLQRLKDDVKRAMLNAIQPKDTPKPLGSTPISRPKVLLPTSAAAADTSSRVASPSSAFGSLTAPPPPPLLPSPSRNSPIVVEKPPSHDTSPLRPARSAAPMGLPSTSGRGILDIGRSRHRLSQSAHLPDIRTDTFGQKTSTRSSVYLADTGEVDWTMPRSLINRFAFVDCGCYDKMVLAQDALAAQTEEQRRRQRRTTDVQHAQSLKDQMAEHVAKEAHEVELKRREAEELEQALRQFEADEARRMLKQRDKQATIQALYDSQVREVRERKKNAEDQQALAKLIERQEHLLQVEEDRLLKEQAKEESRQYREQYQAELKEVVAKREAAVAEKKREEIRSYEEAVRVLEAQEARRRAFVQSYKDKVARMAAKAGSEALQASQDELVAAATARAERLAAEHEANLVEKERKKKLKQQADKLDRLASLNQQIADREAAKRAEAIAVAELKRRVDEAALAEVQRVREAKEAKKVRQRAMVLEQKAAALEERQRRFKELRDPTFAEPEGYHKLQYEGLQPSVANVSVPLRLTAAKATS